MRASINVVDVFFIYIKGVIDMKKDEKEVVEEKSMEANEGVGEAFEPPEEVESADDDQFKGFEPDEEVK